MLHMVALAELAAFGRASAAVCVWQGTDSLFIKANRDAAAVHEMKICMS